MSPPADAPKTIVNHRSDFSVLYLTIRSMKGKSTSTDYLKLLASNTFCGHIRKKIRTIIQFIDVEF